MRNIKAWKILVFTMAVTMLLLRPYLVYQMTGQRVLHSDPAKAYSLLQRLIKKKDDHHQEAGDNTLAETRHLRFSFQPPVKLHQRFYIGKNVISTSQRLFLPGLLANTVFSVRPENHRYRILSCFQI
jgi:hypothetical protein